MSEWDQWRIDTVGGEFTGWSRPGSDPTLLWFHDELDCRPCPMVQRLSDSSTCTIISPTIPGFGDAARPEWVETVRDVADALLDLVDALSLTRCVVGGASFGGWVAAELALRLVDRVDGLLLVAPAGLRRAGFAIADHWYVTDDEQDALLFQEPAARPRPGLDHDLANNEALARYTWSRRFSDPTLASRAHRLTVPTALFWGDRDRLIPDAHALSWLELLPDARLTNVAGSGHYPGHEAAAETADAAAKFLRNIGSYVGTVS